MVENKENRAQPLVVCENENLPKETKKTEERDVALLQNGNRKKSASQKRRKMSLGPNQGVDTVPTKQQSFKAGSQCADELLLDKMESLDVCEDDQGVPLSFKNFFKAVKTFSKRKPKNLKIRDEGVRERRENDVVVFERLATPRSFYKPRRISRSLPPIMDIHDLLSAETQAPEGKVGRDPDCLHSDDKLQTSDSDEPYGALASSEKTTIQPSSKDKKETHRHRCSGFLHELEPDGLQEFGSVDVFKANRDRNTRITRKSLGYLRNTYEEQEALHF